MRYNRYMQTPLQRIASDPNVSKLFRDALQLPFQPCDFRQLLRRESNSEVGLGLSSDVAGYMAGGREVR